MNKNILVCGNGPTCKEIDFTRVPEDVKIMRLTHFYFEEMYNAGRCVDYYVDYAKRLTESYFNARTMHTKKEYDFDLENMWYTVLLEKNPHFPTVKSCTDFIQETPLIAEFRCFYQYYYGQYLPTGMQAVALAVCLGFENVYLTGFDFFSDANNMHAYEEGDAVKAAISNIKKESVYDTGVTDRSIDAMYSYIHKTHPVQMQIDFLNLLQKVFPKTKIMSANSTGVINEHIPCAPVLTDTPWYTPVKKPDDRTVDWYPLPDTMPGRKLQ